MNYKRIRGYPSQDVEKDCQPSAKKFRAGNEQVLNFNDPPASIFNNLKIPRKKSEQKFGSDPLMNTVSPIIPPVPEFENTSRNLNDSATKADNDDISVKLDDKTAKLKYYRCKECQLHLSSQVTLDAHYAGARHAKKLKELGISSARTRSFKKDKISKLTENEFKCKLCDVKMGSLIQITSHIDGNKHKKNIEAYREKKSNKHKNEESSSGIKPIKLASLPVNNNKSVVKTEQNTSFHCSICGSCMNSQQQYDQHINSKKHSAKVTKLLNTVKVVYDDPKTAESVPIKNS